MSRCPGMQKCHKSKPSEMPLLSLSTTIWPPGRVFGASHVAVAKVFQLRRRCHFYFFPLRAVPFRVCLGRAALGWRGLPPLPFPPPSLPPRLPPRSFGGGSGVSRDRGGGSGCGSRGGGGRGGPGGGRTTSGNPGGSSSGGSPGGSPGGGSSGGGGGSDGGSSSSGGGSGGTFTAVVRAAAARLSATTCAEDLRCFLDPAATTG